MEYFLSFDGDWKIPFGTNLLAATNAFEKAIDEHEWCPTIEDSEGVVLISFYSDGYDDAYFTTIIGPEPDKQWYRDYADYPDRIAEEYEYKFGNWRL